MAEGSSKGPKSDGERMKVYLKVTKTITFNVKSSDTISNMKSKFQDMKGVAVNLQNLFFNGNHLDDGLTLAECDVKRGCTLDMIVNSGVGMKIYIRIPSIDKTIILKVKSLDTIHNIKSMIQDNEGIPSDKQMLIFGMKQLDDSLTLEAYNIRHKSTLDVVIQPGEGMQIFVNMPAGAVPLLVKPWNTVQDIKGLIKSMVGAPQEQYQLDYEGKQLEDDQTLANYNIKKSSTLQLVCPMMQIFVKTAPIGKTILGKTIALEVKARHTVRDVKAMIEHAIGAPQNQLNLLYFRKQLMDSRTLADYNIRNKSSLHLVVNCSPMQILVKTFAGKTITLEVKNLDTINDVMLKIKDKEGIPISRQYLVYAGKHLRSDYALVDYWIENGSTLHMRLRIPSAVLNQVTIKMPHGDCIVLYANEYDTIAHLKTMVENKAQIPLSRQKLTYLGMELDNNYRTLKDYDIRGACKLSCSKKTTSEEHVN